MALLIHPSSQQSSAKKVRAYYCPWNCPQNCPQIISKIILKIAHLDLTRVVKETVPMFPIPIPNHLNLQITMQYFNHSIRDKEYILTALFYWAAHNKVSQKRIPTFSNFEILHSVNRQRCPCRSTQFFVLVDQRPFYCNKKGLGQLKQKTVWIDQDVIDGWRCRLNMPSTILSLNE